MAHSGLARRSARPVHRLFPLADDFVEFVFQFVWNAPLKARGRVFREADFQCVPHLQAYFAAIETVVNLDHFPGLRVPGEPQCTDGNHAGQPHSSSLRLADHYLYLRCLCALKSPDPAVYSPNPRTPPLFLSNSSPRFSPRLRVSASKSPPPRTPSERRDGVHRPARGARHSQRIDGQQERPAASLRGGLAQLLQDAVVDQRQTYGLYPDLVDRLVYSFDA